MDIVLLFYYYMLNELEPDARCGLQVLFVVIFFTNILCIYFNNVITLYIVVMSCFARVSMNELKQVLNICVEHRILNNSCRLSEIIQLKLGHGSMVTIYRRLLY